MQFKDFNNKTKYRYIGKIMLMTPHGVLTDKCEHVYTGSMWKKILVYDFSESTPPISKMFKVIKAKNKKSKKK